MWRISMDYQTPPSAAKVEFDRIGQVALTVTDLARAKEFYGNTLGMRFLFDAGTMAFFQCGDIRLLIGVAVKEEPRGGTIVYFKVEDIHAVHENLRARGVEFVDTPHMI